MITFLNQAEYYLFLYKGVDWLIAISVFAGIFLLGDKKREGFILGAVSSALGIIFSIQILSVANGLVSVVFFGFFSFLGSFVAVHKAQVVHCAVDCSWVISVFFFKFAF